MTVAHSITSSATAESPGGISRPSALAALRLITNSNLVDCSTGRDRGTRVARGQSDDPLQARVEEHLAGNRKRAGPMLHERRKRGIQFGVVAGFDHQDLLPDRARRSLHCRRLSLAVWTARIDEYANQPGFRHQVAQQAESLLL